MACRKSMKNQKNDHVSSFVKVIIDRVHGGRKQDRKFWERKIENSRNDLSGFSNREILIEQQEGLAQTLKQVRAKRAVFILGILLVCFVFALVYSRPNLFPFLSYSKIYQSISEYFPEKYEPKNQIKAVAPKPLEEPVESKTAKKEYTFSEEQIARAKFNVENQKKQKGRYYDIIYLKTNKKPLPEIKIRVQGNITDIRPKGNKQK